MGVHIKIFKLQFKFIILKHLYHETVNYNHSIYKPIQYS